MIERSLSINQVEGEAVEVRFLPLSIVKNLSKILWSKNAKKHDLSGVLNSIERYGFIDPPKWDSTLNDGKGGLIYGNGRTKTIVGALIESKRLGHQPPRGIPIAIDSGEWCLPVKFGVDCENEALAIAGAIDHNNLTLSGSDLDIEQVSQIWNDDYVALLSSIAAHDVMPVTVDEDALQKLIEASETPDFGASTLDEQSILDKAADKKEINCICPQCHHEFIRQV
jgi:hypothetical protein